MKITKKVSFSAILIAIAVVILYLGSMIDVLTLSVAAFASLTVMITVAELGFPSAFCVYCAASLLSFLLLPAKETAVVFSAFFGFYPIIKGLADKTKKYTAYIIKTLVFLVSFATSAVVFVAFFGLPADKWYIYSLLFIPALAVFFVYDWLFTRVILYYFQTLRKRLGINKYFR